eukprot:EG_transcript_13227
MESSKANLVLGLKDWVSECPMTDRFPLALCLAQCLRQLLSDSMPPIGEEQLVFFNHCVGSCWRLSEELKPSASPDAATCMSEWDWIQSLQDTDLDDPDSPLSAGSVLFEEEGPVGLAVLVHGALDVPKMDRIGHCDTVAELWVERQCERIAPVQRTQVCWSHANPVWKAYLEFRGDVSEKDVLHVKLKNFNLHRETTIGTGYTPVMALPADEPLELDVISDRQSRSCTVVVQRALPPLPPTKTIFLLRHAQSKWNAAQAAHAFHQMAQYDHPINATGMAQARQFRDQWLSSSPSALQEAFMEAELIFCSPLTRAIQTCLLALQGHPTICSRGLRLLQTAREIKKMGGMDTVGKAAGDRIIDRVREELGKLLPPEEVALLIPHIDLYNTVSNWWKSVVGVDTQKAIARRLESFMSTLRYTP